MSSEPPPSGFSARLEAAGFNPVGSVLVAVGGLLVLVADTVLNWFREGSGFFGGAGSHSTFADLHNLLEQRAHQISAAGVSRFFSFGISRDYFGWLGWLLLAAAVGFGALAVSSFGGAHFTARWFGAVVAATGIGLTLLALNLIVVEANARKANLPASYGDYFSQSGLGAWCAVAGYLVVLVGCLIPRRNR
jgi:hypothetical protein